MKILKNLINPLIPLVLSVILTVLSGILIFLTFAVTGKLVTFDPAAIVCWSLLFGYSLKFHYSWKEIQKYTLMSHMLLWLTMTPTVFALIESTNSLYIVAMSALMYPIIYLGYSELRNKFKTEDTSQETIGFLDPLSQY